MSKRNEKSINFTYGTNLYFTAEEQRLLDYLGIKAVSDTAKEEGIHLGEEKKEIEAVLGMNENDIPISMIAKCLKISESKVRQIIDNQNKE